jgi:hypothetical protein
MISNINMGYFQRKADIDRDARVANQERRLIETISQLSNARQLPRFRYDAAWDISY